MSHTDLIALLRRLVAEAREVEQGVTNGPWARAAWNYADVDALIEDVTIAFRRGGARLHYLTCAPAPGEDMSRFPATTGNGPDGETNARFIAAARAGWPALADAAERAAEALEQLQSVQQLPATAADRALVDALAGWPCINKAIESQWCARVAPDRVDLWCWPCRARRAQHDRMASESAQQARTAPASPWRTQAPTVEEVWKCAYWWHRWTPERDGAPWFMRVDRGVVYCIEESDDPALEIGGEWAPCLPPATPDTDSPAPVRAGPAEREP